MQYIYQNTDWNKFSWSGDKIQNLLLKIKKAQGYLFGKMSNLGFEVQNSATLQMLTENIIKSHEIEGELLDRRSVRSSIAIRLGIDTAGETPYSRNVEGVVEMVLQACHTFHVEANYMQRMCEEEGIPYMKLETDYSTTDSGQIETRLAAFIEML